MTDVLMSNIAISKEKSFFFCVCVCVWYLFLGFPFLKLGFAGAMCVCVCLLMESKVMVVSCHYDVFESVKGSLILITRPPEAVFDVKALRKDPQTNNGYKT